jgi:hypothetical protein
MIERRTIFSAVAAALVWAFFFVPNGLFSFLSVQGNEHLSNVALFGAIPATVGLLLSLGLKSGRLATVLVASGVPLVGIAASLILWIAGYHSNEGLLGAWLYCLWPIPAYALGVVVGVWLRTRLPLAVSP